MRYFFHIAFQGHHYRGWQRQAKALNVQQVVEETLSQILKVPVFTTGCGRTDAQVHASQFFFHADIEKKWNFDLLFRINKALPKDIAVFDIFQVEANHHARFDAIERTYDYFFHTYKDPFLNGMSALYAEKNLDVQKMRQAVSLLPLYHDYRALCKTPDKKRTTICKISSATLLTDSAGDFFRFQISADRFLGKMIRIIVAKLLLIGKNELGVAEFESYLISRKTPDVLAPAHPQGLYLSKVRYPFLDAPARTDFSTILRGKVESLQAV
jgi:tRNA pseudouridine38-40 synthase